MRNKTKSFKHSFCNFCADRFEIIFFSCLVLESLRDDFTQVFIYFLAIGFMTAFVVPRWSPVHLVTPAIDICMTTKYFSVLLFFIVTQRNLLLLLLFLDGVWSLLSIFLSFSFFRLFSFLFSFRFRFYFSLSLISKQMNK